MIGGPRTGFRSYKTARTPESKSISSTRCTAWNLLQHNQLVETFDKPAKRWRQSSSKYCNGFLGKESQGHYGRAQEVHRSSSLWWEAASRHKNLQRWWGSHVFAVFALALGLVGVSKVNTKSLQKVWKGPCLEKAVASGSMGCCGNALDGEQLEHSK